MFRFLLDQTQTPNTKVKVNTLRFLRSVLDVMDASNFPAEDPDLPLAVTKVTSSLCIIDRTSSCNKAAESPVLSLTVCRLVPLID